jgi:SWI/SNF-related matrix-associated actin-dependent regulator of chromatin subfamily A member 5
MNLKNGELKQYQLEALNWLMKLHYMNVNGILADEMGLGKTIQTISLIAYLTLEKKGLFFIIIVPKVTINNWNREIKKWLPEARVLYFYGDKDQRRKLVDDDLKRREFDIILTTFEVAIKEKTNLTKLNYEYLIIDEAHRIKNEKAKLSTVVRQYKAAHRLLLTGTPLQNNLHELWSLLNFLMPNVIIYNFRFLMILVSLIKYSI